MLKEVIQTSSMLGKVLVVDRWDLEFAGVDTMHLACPILVLVPIKVTVSDVLYELDVETDIRKWELVKHKKDRKKEQKKQALERRRRKK